MINLADRQLGIVSWVAAAADDEATVRLHFEAMEEGTVAFLQQVLEATTGRRQ